MAIGPLDYSYTGILANPEWMPTWLVVELPGSNELFGTGNSVRVEGTIDDQPIASALMPSGQGYHFVSVSKALRKKLGKDPGDKVTVRIVRQLT